jgi:protein-S-isoprenylcysteine O-methyltransferase
MVLNPVTAVTTHPLAAALAVALGAAWIVMEYVGRSSTWRQGAPRRPSAAMDRGTYPFIALGLAVGMTTSAVAFLSGLGGYLPDWTISLGAPLMVVGLTTRLWALTTLGRFFTMPITLAADHRIVRDGPYRWLRHPSYTGGLLTGIGMPLVLGTALGLVVTVIALGAVYVYRIR